MFGCCLSFSHCIAVVGRSEKLSTFILTLTEASLSLDVLFWIDDWKVGNYCCLEILPCSLIPLKLWGKVKKKILENRQYALCAWLLLIMSYTIRSSLGLLTYWKACHHRKEKTDLPNCFLIAWIVLTDMRKRWLF